MFQFVQQRFYWIMDLTIKSEIPGADRSWQRYPVRTVKIYQNIQKQFEKHVAYFKTKIFLIFLSYH